MTHAIVFLLLGLVLLVISAESLVRGASRLAAAFGISPLVVGLTVVAFGTSAPELAVSTVATFSGQADIGLGNIVGSNIFNVLVILGLSAVITPLVVAKQLVRLDVPVMIGLSILMWIMGLDQQISRVDGVILFVIAIFYVTYLIRISRRKPVLEAEYAGEFSASKKEKSSWFKNIVMVCIGIGGMILGSKWLVDSAVLIARQFGVSELVIGLTIISLGTSLPEVATSLIAAFRGEKDIAVGNVIGSNIFNIVSVLGISAAVSPKGIPVPLAALHFDIPIMVGIAAVCLPLFYARYRVSRLNGIFFIAIYAAYLTDLLMSATGSAHLSAFRHIMLYYALPFAAISLFVSVWLGRRSLRAA
ncbi:calcium/sodium antiporter [Luteolibacter pohnpeiensis]|uniref:Calcium/sodium antiporter n=1 Tax=Luteolibacter pohnpeiensis TaxID=454153 RepID=A0A934S2I8_9BACT|nr:calcium/sodium antiporter [Luteolibacter pohnpeiensis]MBK1881246.1 calcium/sodium antiporter [Luteolibacter pohnpeiensis]